MGEAYSPTLRSRLARAISLFNDRDEVIEWFGAAVDLTARKQAEDALREADRRKGDFLATLAHELRNPLAPLRNGLQIARLKSQNDVPFNRTIDMMERQVNTSGRPARTIRSAERVLLSGSCG